ncbi:DUF2461 family protein [Actinopolymorpha pittospori]|uniref:TIGR02453 family protein n=1 Tax=Actinopolymorpha pittospori TaxID=648752 RepID=A0A927MX98_9ACTN|nr:DUF2461 family protein [Actinopolymorpha pittospori]MBE1608289.1 hypothetical protein [Actinopolymorpha pittospori]
MGHFTGWPETAFDVLLQLDGDPSVAVREKHRKDREHLVRKPMVALLQDVADADHAYEDFSVWGYGTHPWGWQHQCAVVRMPGRFEIGLRFDLDGLDVSGGWAFSAREEVEKFRAAVADDSSGRALTEVVETLREEGFEVSGDLMKRVPRGYPPDHPRALLLRHRSLNAARHLDGDVWIHTPETVERVVATAAQLRPLLSWLADHVSAQ